MYDTITVNEVIESFDTLITTNFTFVDGIYYFSIEDFETDKKIVVSQVKIEAAIEQLKKSKELDESGIYDNYKLEVHVREESRVLGYSRFRDREVLIDDQDNAIKYYIGSLSLPYILYIIEKAKEFGSLAELLKNPFPRTMLRRKIEEETQDNITIEEYFSFLLFRYQSIRIESNKSQNIEFLNNLLMSFIFQISFNSNSVIIPQRNISDIFRNRRLGRFRRTKIDELDPPRRIYPPDIINHYQMALASESPYLEYLSFYHVMEHFFDSVFNDDLLENIKNNLTAPSFSYKRKKDLMGLVKLVTKAVQVRNEDYTFNENEALRLTLKKYIDVEKLKNDVDGFEPSFINYYKTTKVKFSDGDFIDFDETDESKLLKSLANRIYKTRNSLVHSKDNDKAKYTPFHDDKELIMEIPLLRFISEQIIIKSSKIME
jgi:hypothetical protein